MRSIVAIALKDLRLLWRDKMSMFWVLFFPLLMAVFFGSVFSGMARKSPLTIALVDEDQTPGSQQFIERLHQSSAIKVRTRSGEEVEADDEATPEQLAPFTLAEAQRLVSDGQVAGYVRLEGGFGQSVGFMPNASKIELGIDPSRRVEAGILQGLVLENTLGAFRDLFKDPDRAHEQLDQAREQVEDMEGVGWKGVAAMKRFFRNLDEFIAALHEEGDPNKLPLATTFRTVEVRRQGPSSGYEISFPQSISWGIYGCLGVFAISLVQEQTQGTYLRLRVSPLSRAQILAGKGFACWLACCLVSVLLIAFGWAVFDVAVVDPIGLTLAVTSSSACFVGVMMFGATLGKTERAVGGAMWAINMPLAMLGGSMVPLVAMPPWMQMASDFSPVKWMIQAFEGAIWRGYTIDQMLERSAILLVIGACFYLVGLTIFIRREA